MKKPGLFAFRQRGFLNNVRADGCQYFNTVLGPGYNYDHRNHFHFDIKQRRNNHVRLPLSRSCSELAGQRFQARLTMA